MLICESRLKSVEAQCDCVHWQSDAPEGQEAPVCPDKELQDVLSDEIAEVRDCVLPAMYRRIVRLRRIV